VKEGEDEVVAREEVEGEEREREGEEREEEGGQGG